MFDFLNFKFVDFLDIVLVGLMLYYIYRLLKGTVAISIFSGIVIIFLFWKLTVIVKMELVSSILGQFINVGFFALIVVFPAGDSKVPFGVGFLPMYLIARTF